MFRTFFAITLSVLPLLSYAQKVKKQHLITTQQELSSCIKGKKNKRLVDLTTFIHNLKTDLRYATSNNLTHTVLYHNAKPYLRQPAANALKQVQIELSKVNLGLMIFDAYRPLSATKQIWAIVHDSRYAANPANGSAHNRALAADLTIVDRNGKPLDMGTDFDSFSDSVAHSFKQLPTEVLYNRNLLKTVMERHGFKSLSTEWWHYSWPNDEGYELLDVGFGEIGK